MSHRPKKHKRILKDPLPGQPEVYYVYSEEPTSEELAKYDNPKDDISPSIDKLMAGHCRNAKIMAQDRLKAYYKLVLKIFMRIKKEQYEKEDEEKAFFEVRQNESLF